MRLQGERTGRCVRRSISGILSAMLLLSAAVLTAAAANARTVSTKVDDRNVYLFVKDVTDITGGTVQIGNTVCQDVLVGGLDAFATPLRTVILIDNSQSIKKDSRPTIEAILSGIIDNGMEGEEFRIGTFSHSVTWLCDNTTDHSQLQDALGTLEYINQDTYFSDCLYEVIEDLSAAVDPVYTRIVIVSDGADDRAIGYTNSEVTALLEKSNIPVYTIGILGDNSALETMFSFSRASRADYYLLDGSISSDDVVASLQEDHELTCIRITPDTALLDGGQKSIQATLQTGEGDVVVTATVNMPFASGDMISESTVPAEETPSSQTQQAAEENTLPVLGNTSEASEETPDEKTEGLQRTVLIVVLGAAVLIAVLIIVLLMVLRKKKAEPVTPAPQVSPVEPKTPPPTVVTPQPEEPERTLLLETPGSRDSDVTISLWDQHEPQREPKTYLVLQNKDNPAVMFKVPIKDVIRIGRKDADIVINQDKAISSRHCEIIKRGSLLYIKDLGSSNGTFYENVRVYDQETPIVSGGTIRIGQSNFTVTIITE